MEQQEAKAAGLRLFLVPLTQDVEPSVLEDVAARNVSTRAKQMVNSYQRLRPL